MQGAPGPDPSARGASLRPSGLAFEFATATRIVFGRGRSQELAALAAELGRRALVVTGRSAARHAALLAALELAGVAVRTFAATREPTIEDAEAAVDAARQHGADLVIGLGGGSAIDLGKATAALVTSGGAVLDYLEVVGRGRPLGAAPLPFLAVPTTAGTGAEVTRNAVLEVPEHGVKVSLRSAAMLPKVALVDPLLTLEVPQDVTAATGFDALTQVIEPLLCAAPSPITDALCREGIVRAARSLPRVLEDGHDLDAREDLALASLLGGMALANARLGAVHGFAGPLGGMLHAPHGSLCAALLAPVLSVNAAALAARGRETPAFTRLAELARLLTGEQEATTADGIQWARSATHAAGIPGLSRWGATRADFARMVSAARAASSMKGNPVALSDAELTQVLELAL